MVKGVFHRGVIFALNHLGIVEVAPFPAPLKARVLIFLITLYQISVSKLINRTCLFSPTCSEISRRLLRSQPLDVAIEEIKRQTRRCNPNYSLNQLATGEVILKCSDGTTWPINHISPELLKKLH